MYQIGLMGNSCTGKTTAAFSLVKLLKLRKCLTAYTTDACRFVTFPPERFDDTVDARLHVLFTQLANETEQRCRDDADYLITERTALDWYLYYEWTCQHTGQIPCKFTSALIEKWMNRYDLIFYMDARGMYYVDDGFRPASTRIRDEIEAKYQGAYDWLRATANTQIITGDDLETRNDEVMTHMNDWLDDGHLIVRR